MTVLLTLADLVSSAPAGVTDWTLALCRQVDPDLFYPEQGESPTPAKRICQRCPLQAECLAEALRRHEPYGIWGGTSARERMDMLRPISAPRTPLTIITLSTPAERGFEPCSATSSPTLSGDSDGASWAA